MPHSTLGVDVLACGQNYSLISCARSEAVALPLNNGCRPDQHHGVQGLRPNPVKSHPEEPVDGGYIHHRDEKSDFREQQRIGLRTGQGFLNYENVDLDVSLLPLTSSVEP